MTKKIRINPILKKELMINSRNIKMSMAVMAFNVVFAFIIYFIMVSADSYAITSYYSSITAIFPAVGAVEAAILCLVVPIITSGSISGERERQTLDIMLTTPVKPMAIARGKLLASLATVMMYVISTLPLISMSFIFGGMKWRSIFGYIGIMLYIGIYMGAIGIYASSRKKSSVSATISSLLTLTAIVFITGILFFSDSMFGYSRSEFYYYGTGTYTVSMLTVILAFNPITPVIEFFLNACSGYDLCSFLENMYYNCKIPKFVKFVFENIQIISLAANLLVSYLFMKIASVKIVVTKNKKRNKKRRISYEAVGENN